MPFSCPKCRTIELSPIPGFEQTAEPVAEGEPIEETVPGIPPWAGPPLQCRQCHGLWLARSRIVELAGPGGLQADTTGSSTLPRDEVADKRAGLCPIGHGFLTRARVDLEGTFYLDRCAHCNGIWFDPGEWNRLVGSPLIGHLEDLWDAGVQKRLREEQSREKYLQHIRRELGEELFEQVSGLAAVLKDHPRRTTVLAYLQDALGVVDHEEAD